MSDVLRVKEKADIVDVISSYIELSQAGKSFKGNCPFHNEKTPSFFVSPERQSYYCFGCGAKGDVISFIEQYDSLDFIGALKLLAERVGVELTRGEHKGKRDELVRMYDMMEVASDTFVEWLKESSSVMDYVKGRGLSDRSIDDWRIGFAKDEWRGIHDILIRRKFTANDMKSVGLVRDIEGGRIIDLFRNRVMFPIRDISGRVIAFSGRTLSTDKHVPKYVNSPETHIFKKSATLFGLYEAKQFIRKAGYVILVEGQMDVLMLHEKGLRNTVASSGTAFTSEQARIIKRMSSKLVLLYDGDEAGRNASLRAAQIALAVGIETKIARMPDGVDPADLALRDPDTLTDILRKAEHAIFVATKMVLESEPRPERRVALVTKQVLSFVHFLETESLKDHFLQELSRMLGVSKDSLQHDLQHVADRELSASWQEKDNESRDAPVAQEPETSRMEKIFRHILGIMSWLEHDKTAGDMVAYMQKYIDTIWASCTEEEKNNLTERVRDEGSAFEAEKFYQHVSPAELKRIVDDVLTQFHIEMLRTQYNKASDPQQKVYIRKEIDILTSNSKHTS